MTEPLRVLMSFGDPSRTRNPFTQLLADSLPADRVQLTYFTWKAALSGRYDLFHVHWPHSLAGSRKVARGARNAALTMLLLALLRVRRQPIVWTVHNRIPHERMHAPTRMAMRVLERQVACRVVMTGVESEVPGPDWEKIPHGHYRDAYALELDSTPPSLPTILHFGLLRPYKNTDGLILAARDVGTTLRLVIAGKPVPESFGERLAILSEPDSRVSLRPEFVPNEELPRLLAESTLVALPYTEMYNSGAALLALSANRPVLMPSSPATSELISEFGDQWVIAFDGPLTGSTLKQAVDRAVGCAGQVVDMSRREWPVIGQQYANLYARLVKLR